MRLTAIGILLAMLTGTSCPLAEPINLAREAAWIRHTIDDASRGADGVRLADVNGDGHLDIATGWEEGRVTRVYLHPGKEGVKARWPAVTVGQVASPEDAVLVDLDGDGAVDVVSSCEGNERTVFVHWAPTTPEAYLNPAAWQTQAITATLKKQMWMFAVPMQIDGAHGLDLVVGSKGNGGSIGWLQAPADPRDVDGWVLHTLYDAGWIMSLIAIDFDHDGDTDIVASDRKGPARGCLWLENPGPSLATQPWPVHRIGPGDWEVMFIDVVDIDRDGQWEVLAATRGRELVLYKHDAAAVWHTQLIAIPDSAGTAKSVRVADVTGDGRPNIVVSCEQAKNKYGVLLLTQNDQHAEGPWSSQSISGLIGTKFDLVELIDLDGDDDLDVLTCEEAENLGVIWYENPLR